jgi:DNA segregation ATPase FtsK/SpoIIIE, S-DNA-T family
VSRRSLRDNQVAALRTEINATRLELGSVAATGSAAVEAVHALWTDQLATPTDHRDGSGTVIAEAAHRRWQLDLWKSWDPLAPTPSGLRVGTFLERRTGHDLDVPITIPFVTSYRPLLVSSDNPTDRATASGLVSSLVIRLRAMYPGQSKFVLLDPAGNGLGFPVANGLDDTEIATSELRGALDDVTEHIARVANTYLDVELTSFEEIPDDLRRAEQYRFVVAADFPNGYDRRAVETLTLIARTGPRAGVHLIIEGDAQGEGFVREVERLQLVEPLRLDPAATHVLLAGIDGHVAFDPPPSPEMCRYIQDRTRALPLRDQVIGWPELSGLDVTQWWQHSSAEMISAPLGRVQRGDPFEVWFGTDPLTQRSCVHGVIGAMPGSGKSTLLHSLIASLCVRYSPEELRFALIDGKHGVEFGPYVRLPHADVVSLKTTPGAALSVLEDLLIEMERRFALFVEHGVNGVAAYRARTGRTVPRILLIIDEYQQLFDRRTGTSGADALLRLTQQGRSAGVHVLLTSQRFDATGVPHHAEILGNLHLRIALQVAQGDALTIKEFGTDGRRMIAAHCDRAGRIVLNDHAGADGGNIAGKVALLEADDRDTLIERLAALATHRLGQRWSRPALLNGDELPRLLDNPLLQPLLQSPQWPTRRGLEAFARRDQRAGGLGIGDWREEDRPIPLFVGREHAVRRQLVVPLRRGPNEHVVIVADSAAARHGMICGALTSAVSALSPEQLSVVVCERVSGLSQAPTMIARLLATVHAAGVKVTQRIGDNGLRAALDNVAAEIEGRLADPDATRRAASLLLIIDEPERSPGLRQVVDDAGETESPLGATLRSVITTGPAVGVHVVVTTASLDLLRTVLPDSFVQRHLRHRIVQHVSDDDSFVLVRSSAAARQSMRSGQLESAVHFDAHRRTLTPFDCYVAGGGADQSLSPDDLGELANRLGARHAATER